VRPAPTPRPPSVCALRPWPLRLLPPKLECEAAPENVKLLTHHGRVIAHPLDDSTRAALQDARRSGAEHEAAHEAAHEASAGGREDPSCAPAEEQSVAAAAVAAAAAAAAHRAGPAREHALLAAAAVLVLAGAAALLRRR
jgi:hypothetical protein